MDSDVRSSLWLRGKSSPSDGAAGLERTTVPPQRREPLPDLDPSPQEPRDQELLRAAMAVGIAPVLVLMDTLALVAAALFTGNVAPPTLLLLAGVIGLYANGGLYRSRLTLSLLDDLPAMLQRALVAGALVTAFGAFMGGVNGAMTMLTAVVFAVNAALGRSVGYASLRNLRRTGILTHRTLILGGGQMAGQMAQTLLDHPEYGLKPVGFLDDDPLLAADQRPIPHLGGYGDLTGIITEFDVGNVVVAFGSIRESVVVDSLRECDRLSCEIFLIPRLYELAAMNRDMDIVWGIPMVRLRRAAFRSLSWRLKRVVDVLLSALALIVLSPLLVAIALLVRLETKSYILFRQERVGLDGRSFTMLKFSSLRPADDSESEQRWNVAHDSRIGIVGKMIRRTSLDELPQLWNILRGDMSVVGPRPERPFFVGKFTRQFPRYMARHRVPAGLTGWAQVHGLRGDTSIGDRARFDNCYIENWSVWTDCKIVLRTFGQIVRAVGR